MLNFKYLTDLVNYSVQTLIGCSKYDDNLRFHVIHLYLFCQLVKLKISQKHSKIACREIMSGYKTNNFNQISINL